MPHLSSYTKGLAVSLADARGEVRRLEREARLLDAVEKIDLARI
jgi:hypothetical protein